MGIFTSILVGCAAFVGYASLTMKAIDRKLQKYNINIDAVKENLEIKCAANKISKENFKVYARLENGKQYLYIMGAAISDNNRDVITVKQKYRIDSSGCLNFTGLSWDIVDEDVVVNIPLKNIDTTLKVKKVAL